MPIYEFKCRQCGRVVEVLQRGAMRTEKCQCRRRLRQPGHAGMISASNLIRMGCGSGSAPLWREERCETAPCSGNCQCPRG